MRQPALAILLATVPVAGADQLTGTWSGTLHAQTGGQAQEVAMVLVLQQHRSALSGTLRAAGKDPVPIRHGRIAGARVTFDLLDQNPALQFDGALSGSQLQFHFKGTVRVDDGEHPLTGTLNLKRD